MPAPGPSKRPWAGGSSLDTVAAPMTEENLVLNSCILFFLCVPYHYYRRVACHSSSEVRTATHSLRWVTGCEPWQTNTPQHAERSVPENIKSILIITLFFVVCNVICSICVAALYELSTLLCGWYDSTHRLRIAAPHAAPVLGAGAVLKVSRKPALGSAPCYQLRQNSGWAGTIWCPSRTVIQNQFIPG